MKTKDFNLEEALAGATVVYVDILCKLYHIPESKTYPYLLVLKNSGEIIGWYDESYLKDLLKLLDETPLVERWVNVYWDGTTLWVTMHETKEKALSQNCNTNYRIKTIHITNEKGGDDE